MWERIKTGKKHQIFLGHSENCSLNKLNHSVLIGFTALLVVAYYFFRKQNSNFILEVLLYIIYYRPINIYKTQTLN